MFFRKSPIFRPRGRRWAGRGQAAQVPGLTPMCVPHSRCRTTDTASGSPTRRSSSPSCLQRSEEPTPRTSKKKKHREIEASPGLCFRPPSGRPLRVPGVPERGSEPSIAVRHGVCRLRDPAVWPSEWHRWSCGPGPAGKWLALQVQASGPGSTGFPSLVCSCFQSPQESCFDYALVNQCGKATGHK